MRPNLLASGPDVLETGTQPPAWDLSQLLPFVLVRKVLYQFEVIKLSNYSRNLVYVILFVYTRPR